MLVFASARRSACAAGGGFPVYRAYYQLPNALAWPMVSFPVGYDSTVGLPIAAQFWGPRFSEPQIVQAAIDYQEHYPAVPQRGPARPGHHGTAKVAPRMLRRPNRPRRPSCPTTRWSPRRPCDDTS